MAGPDPHYPVPGCYEVELIYDIEETTNLVENVYHVAYTPSPDPVWMTSLADTFANWDNTSLKPRRGLQSALLNIRVRDLSSMNGYVITKGYNQAGTFGGAHLPSHCTWAVKWSTGRAGRSYRGRTYHIGLTASHLSAVDQNTMDATQAAAIVAAYQGLITTVTTFGASLVILSRRNNKVWLNPPQTHPITTAGYADLYVDSQRRRLPGHNRHR